MKRHLLTLSIIALVLFLSPMVLIWGEKSQPKNADVKKDNSTKAKVVHRVTSTEKDAEKTFTEKLDALFGTAVKYSAKVLFYKVGAHERTYVELDHQEDYYRSEGSTKPFQRVSPEGTFKFDKKQKTPSTQLTLDNAKALMARGELVLSKTKDEKTDEFNIVRQGELKGEKVEYISVKIKVGDVYVLTEDGNYHKKSKLRDSLDEKDFITQKQVDELASLDRLKKDKDKVKKSDDKPYLLSKQNGGMPLVVLWLALGAVFFTIYMKGFNFWGFKHSLEIVRGKFDNPNEPGEVTHFQALCSALSATVGLGNIAGVTIAMTMGGPGAFFWMLLCGLFGMSSKFVECTLGQKYRHVKPDGTILGGPMRYLKTGLAEIGLGKLGIVLSLYFTVMCLFASFGGGNMFQANQSGLALVQLTQMKDTKTIESIDTKIKEAGIANNIKLAEEKKEEKRTLEKQMKASGERTKLIFGIVLAAVVGIVIIGGIKRIGATAEKIVPLMCLIYIIACLYIILVHIAEVPNLIGQIFNEAFTGKAISGGMVGVIVIGVKRAAFSNEAGVGSAAIAHSAAKTEEPIREGAVAMMGPFIDTIVVCSMTALVILITGAWKKAAWVVGNSEKGAEIASKAFEQEISWFPYVLTVAIMLFAFSTIISWSYYGEKCCEELFGPRSIMVYKCLAILACIGGAVFNAGSVLVFSDIAILSMAFPNILGAVLLSPKIKRDLIDYWKRYRAGEFKTYK